MQHNYVKSGWDRIKNKIDNISNVYSYEDTMRLLKKNDFYKTLFGRAKNRTLIKNDSVLYKSIYHYTEILEKEFKKQNSYKGWYNFAYRVKFLVEYNCDITKLRCKCGKKLSWSKYCRFCPEYHMTRLGKPHSVETKKKMRISTLRYLTELNGQIVPRYNKNSIELIEDFGKKHGYKFRHAENGGEIYIKELGYWLDAYDEQNNVVLEIYERCHYRNGKLRAKDVLREKEIKDFLGCKFYTITI